VEEMEEAETVETHRPYVITDFKNKVRGGNIPRWVGLWLDSGIHEVEAMYQDRYVFIGLNEGNNLRALNLWLDGFSPELDFPRLAAARIEARFSRSVPLPDDEYGAFFIDLIRAASDAPWIGAQREDDFWILKKYLPGDDEPENENWEFFVLVTIEKNLFTSQLDSLFKNIKPSPSPSRYQANAAKRVKEHFFEGF
jgi:hypothetical protein